MVALGNGSSCRKGQRDSDKDSTPTYLLHSDLNLSIHLLPLEILGPVKERKAFLSKNAGYFTLSSLFPKVLLPPEVGIQAHSLPTCSDMTTDFLSIYAYYARDREEYRWESWRLRFSCCQGTWPS